MFISDENSYINGESGRARQRLMTGKLRLDISSLHLDRLPLLLCRSLFSCLIFVSLILSVLQVLANPQKGQMWSVHSGVKVINQIEDVEKSLIF